MKHATHRRHARGALIAALAFGMAVMAPIVGQAQTAQGSFERTLSVSGTVDLNVTTGSGDVIIRSGPAGSEVSIAASRNSFRDGFWANWSRSCAGNTGGG